MNLSRRWVLWVSLLIGVSGGHAAAVKDREGAVRGDKVAMANDARWIYHAVDRGFAEAKKTGKPLLVVLRCVLSGDGANPATCGHLKPGHRGGIGGWYLVE